MTKRSVIRCILSVLMLVYLVVALSFISSKSASDSYNELVININENPRLGFLSPEEVNAKIDYLGNKIKTYKKSEINTREIERLVMELDKVERVNCVELNSGKLLLDVVPLVPVARVFDINNGRNFYINSAGKRMISNPKFRIDVPVVVGRFQSNVNPTVILPVANYLEHHPKVATLVSSYKVAKNGDIILIPVIKGHVVNLGDTTALENKFDRLITFYRRVMPVKGWELYDTLTLKWQGQLVAHKHLHTGPDHIWPIEQEVYIDDESTMTAVVSHNNLKEEKDSI